MESNNFGNGGGGSSYSRGGRGGGRGHRGRGGRGGFGGHPGNQPYLTNKYKAEDKIALKLKGLPYQVRYDEIADFFKDYSYVEKSTVLGIGADGRKNGFGAVLIADEATAEKAMNDLN